MMNEAFKDERHVFQCLENLARGRIEPGDCYDLVACAIGNYFESLSIKRNVVNGVLIYCMITEAVFPERTTMSLDYKLDGKDLHESFSDADMQEGYMDKIISSFCVELQATTKVALIKTGAGSLYEYVNRNPPKYYWITEI